MGMGFEGVKSTLDWNRQQKPLEQEEIEKNQCPNCCWPLKVNKEGKKSCSLCGKTYD